MKPVIFFFFLVLTANAYSQTTLEEYNYVTKGYKVQIESGLDMKQGYKLEDAIIEKKFGERSISAKALYKIKNTTKQKVAYMLIYRKAGNETEYICIPQPNSGSEIVQKFWDQLYDGSGDSTERLQLISFAISYLIDWK